MQLDGRGSTGRRRVLGLLCSLGNMPLRASSARRISSQARPPLFRIDPNLAGPTELPQVLRTELTASETEAGSLLAVFAVAVGPSTSRCPAGVKRGGGRWRGHPSRPKPKRCHTLAAVPSQSRGPACHLKVQ